MNRLAKELQDKRTRKRITKIMIAQYSAPKDLRRSISIYRWVMKNCYNGGDRKMKRLSTSEWRLLLLSECIKNWDFYKNPEVSLYIGHKNRTILLDKQGSKKFNELIDDTDCRTIREQLQQEWQFTGEVKDNGKGNYTVCEYCGQQHIRYRYLCKNIHNGIKLSLGGVCVGRVIHGEHMMKDKKFSDNFIDNLNKLKDKAVKTEKSCKILTDYTEKRQAQHKRLQESSSILREHGYMEDEFFKGINSQWNCGKMLTDNQEKRFIQFANKVKEYNTKYCDSQCKFKNMDARLQYHKVVELLQNHPQSNFLQNCKSGIEKYGCLTQKMINALFSPEKVL